MTVAQTREQVLKVLSSWNRPVNTISQVIADAANDNPTVQMILDAARRQGVWVGRAPRNLTAREQVVLSPEFVQRFAQTTINPDYFCTVSVSNGSPGRSVIVQLPNPE
jgi:hypothetical protein